MDDETQSIISCWNSSLVKNVSFHVMMNGILDGSNDRSIALWRNNLLA